MNVTPIYTLEQKNKIKKINCAVTNIYQEFGGDIMHIKELQEA
jgi:hypothetical protein